MKPTESHTLLTDAQAKHIDIIQDVIKRLAHDSFVVRGWSVTLVTAIFALLPTQEVHPAAFLLAIIPAYIFWYLDASYLRLERLFRALYQDVIDDINDPQEEPRVAILSMDVKNYANTCSVIDAMMSGTVIAVPILVTLFAVLLTILYSRPNP